jgi:hypothetical protein
MRKVKKHTVTTYKPIRLASALPASSPTTSMVSLLPATKPKIAQPDRFQILAADLTDAYGLPIDGNDDGQPGGNYVAIITRKGATPAIAKAGPLTRAVDALLQTWSLDGVPGAIKHGGKPRRSFSVNLGASAAIPDVRPGRNTHIRTGRSAQREPIGAV